jgi:hypothetical protein
MSLRSIVQRVESSSPTAKKIAVLAAVAALVGSFAACHALGEDNDSANQNATSGLPDWTNDMSKHHRQ